MDMEIVGHVDEDFTSLWGQWNLSYSPIFEEEGGAPISISKLGSVMVLHHFMNGHGGCCWLIQSFILSHVTEVDEDFTSL